MTNRDVAVVLADRLGDILKHDDDHEVAVECLKEVVAATKLTTAQRRAVQKYAVGADA